MERSGAKADVFLGRQRAEDAVFTGRGVAGCNETVTGGQTPGIFAVGRIKIIRAANAVMTTRSPAVGGSNDFYATYGENAWGLTACDSLVAPGYPTPSEYCVFGALPTEENIRFGTRPLHLGTIAVYGGRLNQFPSPAAIAALRRDFEIPNLWSPLLGFGDAYSLDPHYIRARLRQNRKSRAFTSPIFLNGPWVNKHDHGRECRSDAAGH